MFELKTFMQAAATLAAEIGGGAAVRPQAVTYRTRGRGRRAKRAPMKFISFDCYVAIARRSKALAKWRKKS